jgi:mono/diheme cytochrome c family protein
MNKTAKQMKPAAISTQTKHSARRMCSALWWTAAVCFTASGFQTPAPPTGRASAPPPSPARELVSKYCVSCHNQKLKNAGLTLDNADAEHVSNSAETWEKVIVKLRSRAMPPPGIRRPDNAAYDSVAGWLESEIDRAAAAHLNPGRTPSLHRLNRTEYANAIRDLIAVDVDAQAMLPPDEQAFGFDTNGDALTMQPALLDRYVSAAAKIARRAVGDATIPPAFERYGAIKGNANEQTFLRQTERLSEDFPLGSRGGIAVKHFFPADGEYVFKLRLQRTFGSTIRGLNVPVQFEIRVDGKRVAQFTLGGRPPAAPAERAGGPKPEGPRQNLLYDGDDALQARVPVKAGLRQVVATMLKSSDPEPEGVGPDYIPVVSRQSDTPAAPAAISSLLIGGPYHAQVPKDSPSRRLIFVCNPETKAEEMPCATKILTRLARRAYRRLPADEDVQTLLGFYKPARAAGSFDDGIRAALERVLVSPDFLFRIEADPAGASPGAVYRISDIELASRLSFALWSSIPDDTLLDLAIAGKLKDPAVLQQQVSRMLADPRARESLVQNFFEEWLQVRNVWLLNPEGAKFPWFDDNLRIAFVKEIELFLDAQLKEDHSVADLLTSNETFLNEQLARHYGIPGVYGSHFRRVTLTDQNRFGLLGKASVLAVTSYTTRTSPTIRGKWLLENILAAPMPAPPPNVPALEASNKEGKPLSVRQMLEMHRANPTCASCHARMDPLGLSLENFDAIGQWRTTDAGVPVDASGVLLDGTKVNGAAELRQALVAQKQQFVRAVTGKLMTYMLGRGLEYTDAPAIRGIVRAAEHDNYRWSSIILGIVNSAPFQMRRAGS